MNRFFHCFDNARTSREDGGWYFGNEADITVDCFNKAGVVGKESADDAGVVDLV
jgi:hypothetical protein